RPRRLLDRAAYLTAPNATAVALAITVVSTTISRTVPSGFGRFGGTWAAACSRGRGVGVGSARVGVGVGDGSRRACRVTAGTGLRRGRWVTRHCPTCTWERGVSAQTASVSSYSRTSGTFTAGLGRRSPRARRSLSEMPGGSTPGLRDSLRGRRSARSAISRPTLPQRLLRPTISPASGSYAGTSPALRTGTTRTADTSLGPRFGLCVSENIGPAAFPEPAAAG